MFSPFLRGWIGFFPSIKLIPVILIMIFLLLVYIRYSYQSLCTTPLTPVCIIGATTFPGAPIYILHPYIHVTVHVRVRAGEVFNRNDLINLSLVTV